MRPAPRTARGPRAAAALRSGERRARERQEQSDRAHGRRPRQLGVVAAALHGDLALEIEDLHLLDLVALLRRTCARAASSRGRRGRDGPGSRARRGSRCSRRPCRRRRSARCGGRSRSDVAERVVADVGRRDAEAEVERDAAEDDQLAADVALGILRSIMHWLQCTCEVLSSMPVSMMCSVVTTRPRECSMTSPGVKSSK